MNFAQFLNGMMQPQLPPPPPESEVNEMFERLKLKPGASVDDVRKAYRKMALRMHPDRGGDPDTFARLQEAYELLGDESTRAVYLRCGLEGVRAGVSAADIDPHSHASQQVEDLVVPLRCELRDLMRPQTREVRFRRVVAERGDERQEAATTEVVIPAGAPDGFPVRVTEEGHSVDGKRGDLIVQLRVRDHPVYNRRGPDLIVQTRVTLRQALAGFVISLPRLDADGDLRVGVPPGRVFGDPVVIRGHGLPLTRSGDPASRGAVILAVKMAVPSNGPGLQLSQEFAALAAAELKPTSEAEAEVEEGTEAYRPEEFAAESPAPNAVLAPYETMPEEELRAQQQVWQRSCGAERVEEERERQSASGGGPQVVQCAHQ